MLRLALVFVLAVSSVAVAVPTKALAQAEYCFPETTGRCVRGAFAAYWTAHGGLVRQGYPLSDELLETSQADGRVYIVQYFERARFEYHPELAGSAFEVELGQLGREQFLAAYPDGRPPGGTGEVCFPETGRCTSSVFLTYWQRNGGLAQFGYAISDLFEEISPTDGKPYLTQYFERARFEYHPEHAAPNDILLGLIGREALQAAYPSALTPGYVFTQPPGSALPDGAACAARVRRSAWEPRPENTPANRPPAHAPALPGWPGHDPRANRDLLPRIDGGFTGTTDEILQWAACKWGLDEDVARAVAVQESDWRQAMAGDVEGDPAHCAPGYAPPCPTSFGLTQVRWYIWPGTFPHARDSTPFAADYAFGQWRACYEGYTTWLREIAPSYGPGDTWGCLGLWFAGRWHDARAEDYIAKVQNHVRTQTWRSWDNGAATGRGQR